MNVADNFSLARDPLMLGDFKTVAQDHLNRIGTRKIFKALDHQNPALRADPVAMAAAGHWQTGVQKRTHEIGPDGHLNLRIIFAETNLWHPLSYCAICR